MMQLGSNNDGGRSSILSPLAHPFTLDESNCNHPHEFPEFQPNNNSPSDSLYLGASDRPYNSNMVDVEDAESVTGKDTSDDLLGNFGSEESTGSIDVDLELSRVWRGMSNEEKRNWLKNLGGSLVPQDYKPHPRPIPSGVWNGMSIEEQCESLRYFGSRFSPQGFKHAQIDPELSHIKNGLSVEQHNSLNRDGSCISEPPRPDLGWSHSHGWSGVTNAVQQMPLKSFGPHVDPEWSRKRNDMSNAEQGKSLNKSSVSSTSDVWVKKVGSSKSYVEAPVKSKNWSDVLPYHPLGLNFQVRSDVGNADNFLTRSPSPISDYNVKYKKGNEDCLDQVVHAEYVPSSPHLSVTGCLQKRSDTGFSNEILSDGPQIQNPAVELPCSKGALAAHFSPVEDSKLVHPHDYLEKWEVHENNSSVKSSDANNICKLCGSRLKIHTGMKLYPGDGFRSPERKNGLDDVLENEPIFVECNGVASTTRSLQIHLVDHEAVPVEKNHELKGECVDLAASRRISCSTTNVSDEILHSPSENLSASKVHLFGKDLHSKVDMGMLINTMKSLSEVLVDRCLSSDTRPSELYNVALKDIIINLNSCLVKEIDQVTEMEKAVDPQQGTHSLGDTQQSPMVRNITTTNTDPHGFDILGDVQYTSFGSRNEGSEAVLDSSFLRGDAEAVQDVDTIQAIKRALNVKFPSDAMHPETVLYKNLWLEAEASLCAINITSRFKSLQKEMEIREYRRMNDEENIPNPETCAVNEISEPLIQAVNSLDSSKLNCSANMESSTVARFQTPIYVVEDLMPSNSTVNHKETLPSPSATPQSNANDIEASLKYHTEDRKVPSRNSEIPPSSNPSQDSCLSAGIRKISLMPRLQFLKSWTGYPDSLRHMDAHQQPEPVCEPTLSSSIYAQNRSSDDVQSVGEGVEDCLGGSVACNPGNDKFFEEWEHVYKEDLP